MTSIRLLTTAVRVLAGALCLAALVPLDALAADDLDERVAALSSLQGSPSKGSDRALVTIVEWADLQCPFCARVAPTLSTLLDEYPGQVRLVFRHQPLAFHREARAAAIAAMAAHKQGRFWAFQARAFENARDLSPERFVAWAEELRLDVKRFKRDLTDPAIAARIDEDARDGTLVGARGTPTFFLNGAQLSGAQPLASFKKAVDEELAAARKAIESGVSRRELYATRVRANAERQLPAARAPSRAREQVQFARLTDLDGAPVTGPSGAKVTIVEFADFQCPFCARVQPTLVDLLEQYPNDVRLVFKHRPLPFHPHARPAAIASMAAHAQGAFWPFHDRAFKNASRLDAEKYVEWARELGLDVHRFRKDLSSDRLAAAVVADSKYAESVGAQGTPTFFLNGRKLVGSQPRRSFETMVKEEIAKANTLLARGVSPQRLYEELLAQNEKLAPPPPPTAAQEDAVAGPVDIDLGDSPSRGNSAAPVTLVVFSDFQCPFCGRAVATVAKLEEKYGHRLRVVFKNQPLPFHKDARPAARAALAAHEQGRFWEMHDLLFENQRALTQDDLVGYASQLGLDLHRFEASMESKVFDARIDADIAQAQKVGATGTPTFFINGVKLVGSQPFERFDAAVQEALADTRR